MSQSYYFGDQAGSIPGVPGMFSHCIVEIDDNGQVTVGSLPGGQHPLVVEATAEPVGAAEITPEGIVPIQPIVQEQPVQEQAPEPVEENTN